MTEHLSAPDLGAIRERWANPLVYEHGVYRRPSVAQSQADVHALLAAYDAQARELERLRTEDEQPKYCRWCEQTTDNCGFPGSDVPPCGTPCGYPLEDCALQTDIEMLKAENTAQAAQLAVAQTAGDADPALYHDMESLRRRAPFAYGQWRADLAFLLETVDAQAARLAAVEAIVTAADRWADELPMATGDAGLRLMGAVLAWRAAGAGEARDGK